MSYSNRELEAFKYLASTSKRDILNDIDLSLDKIDDLRVQVLVGIFDDLNEKIRNNSIERIIELIEEILTWSESDFKRQSIEYLEFANDLFGRLVDVSNCKKFVNTFVQKNGLKPLVELLNSLKLYYGDYGDHKINTEIREIHYRVLGFLQNLAKSAHEHKDLWMKSKCLEVVQNKMEIFNNDQAYLTSNSLIIACLYNVIDTERPINIFKLIELLSSSILQLAMQIERGMAFRFKANIFENDDKLYDISELENDPVSFSLNELIDGVYRLSNSNEHKMHVFHYCELKTYLNKIIFKGNQVEKYFAIKLLFKLCSNIEILDNVSNNPNLVSYIMKLSKESDLNALDNICKEFNYILENKDGIRNNADENIKNVPNYSFEIKPTPNNNQDDASKDSVNNKATSKCICMIL